MMGYISKQLSILGILGLGIASSQMAQAATGSSTKNSPQRSGGRSMGAGAEGPVYDVSFDDSSDPVFDPQKIEGKPRGPAPQSRAEMHGVPKQQAPHSGSATWVRFGLLVPQGLWSARRSGVLGAAFGLGRDFSPLEYVYLRGSVDGHALPGKPAGWGFAGSGLVALRADSWRAQPYLGAKSGGGYLSFSDWGNQWSWFVGGELGLNLARWGGERQMKAVQFQLSYELWPETAALKKTIAWCTAGISLGF